MHGSAWPWLLARGNSELRDITFERTETHRDRVDEYFAEGARLLPVSFQERDSTRMAPRCWPARKARGTASTRRTSTNLIAHQYSPDVETGAGLWTDDIWRGRSAKGSGMIGARCIRECGRRPSASCRMKDVASIVIPAQHSGDSKSPAKDSVDAGAAISIQRAARTDNRRRGGAELCEPQRAWRVSGVRCGLRRMPHGWFHPGSAVNGQLLAGAI